MCFVCTSFLFVLFLEESENCHVNAFVCVYVCMFFYLSTINTMSIIKIFKEQKTMQ